MVERGLVFAGFTRDDTDETDLARGLRLGVMDLGLMLNDGSALAMSTSSVSEECAGAILAFLVVLDRVRTLL